jgi:hypothetical protein
MTPRSADVTTTPGTPQHVTTPVRSPITPFRVPGYNPSPQASHVPYADTARLDDPFVVIEAPASLPTVTFGPEPIFPLLPGQPLSLTLPRLNANRTHGFYVIIRGLKIGIFYCYW